MLFILASCSRPETATDSLLFVQGMSMDPDTPRKAIKLTPDSLYYCVEKMHLEHSGNYKYYGRKFNKDSFYAFKSKADKLFANVGFTRNDIADATVYSIVVKEKGKFVFRKEFVDEYLDENQLKFVQQLEKMFDGDFELLPTNSGINDGLLIEMIPEPLAPPPFPSGSDYYTE